MRTRLREQVRPDDPAGPAQAPGRDSPVLPDPASYPITCPITWRRAALTAEDAALPGRMLVLLSRLHRSEMRLKAETEATGA